MTQKANRAAAKAYMQEVDARRREEVRAKAAAEDLAELKRLRHYLIFELQSKVSGRPLIDAIDDLAEQITGDRTALHVKGHSIP